MRLISVFIIACASLVTTAAALALQPVPTVKFEGVDREFYVARSREELAESKVLIERLKTAPIDDAELRAELERRYNELAPAYLYYLAERTFPTDREAAVEWYWLGHLRARLDAVLCSDTTAAQGIRYLPGAAPSISAYLRDNPKQGGEIGLKVLKRDGPATV